MISSFGRAFIVVSFLLIAFTPGSYAQAQGLGFDNPGTWLYKYSTTGGSCLSCQFISYFVGALAAFSKATYQYFHEWFSTLVPLAMSIWILWRAARLMIAGGESGQQMMYDVVRKLALFSIVWSILMSGGNLYAWQTVGPGWIGYSFDVAEDIRARTVMNAPGANNTSCVSSEGKSVVTVKGVPPSVSEVTDFVRAATLMSCTVERSHIVGLASGAAVIGSALSLDFKGWLNITDNLIAVLQGLVRAVIGAFILVVFAISMIYFIFLILDVVVKGLLTSAFLPVLSGMALFGPSRPLATRAFQGLVGAMATSVGLAVVLILSVFLISNVVTVYEITYPQIATEYGSDRIKSLYQDAQSDDPFLEFLTRIQASSNSNAWVPMNITDPWYIYFTFVALSIFAIGKKIISMIENIIGTEGLDVMASSATKIGVTSTKLAMRGGGMTLAGISLGARYLTPAVASAAGFGQQLTQSAALPAAGIAGGLASQVNPMGNPERDAGRTMLGRESGRSFGGEVRGRAFKAATESTSKRASDVFSELTSDKEIDGSTGQPIAPAQSPNSGP